jgi:hypothetical protein
MRIEPSTRPHPVAETALLHEPRQALANTLRAMLQAFNGSDVKLPNRGAAQPGDVASAAPDVNELNGTVTAWSPQALAAQRFAMGPAGRAADEAFNTDTRHVVGDTATRPMLIPLAAELFGGELRDGQASDTRGGGLFNAALRLRA